MGTTFFPPSSKYYAEEGFLRAPPAQTFCQVLGEELCSQLILEVHRSHPGCASETELCIFPAITHKHVILQTFCSRCSKRRVHSRRARNHRTRYFPLVQHVSKAVASCIKPKLQQKFQAPSHIGPVYSSTEA